MSSLQKNHRGTFAGQATLSNEETYDEGKKGPGPATLQIVSIQSRKHVAAGTASMYFAVQLPL